jgi:hypothetical protein
VKKPYTPCKLFIDGLPALDVGDYLRTSAGSAYLVQSIRQNRNKGVSPAPAMPSLACGGDPRRRQRLPSALVFAE